MHDLIEYASPYLTTVVNKRLNNFTQDVKVHRSSDNFHTQIIT
jgi:hypothetical protein